MEYTTQMIESKIMPSSHKNYVPDYGRNRGKIINEVVLPNESSIFQTFQNKFHSDAEKDGSRGREKLKTWGNICAECSEKIHNNLVALNHIQAINFENIVNDICNMDYESLQIFFKELRRHYLSRGYNNTVGEIGTIIETLQNMWDISKKHVIILEEKSD